MKRTLLIIASGWQISVAAFAQSEPAGLAVYQDPQVSYPEASEFWSIRKETALSWILIDASGQQKPIKATWVIATLDYPPSSFDDSFPDIAHSVLNRIEKLDSQLPRVSGELGKARGKWQRALSVYEQTHKGAAPQKLISLPTLTVKAVPYSNVRLTDTSSDSATITHSVGVAKIPLTELDVPKIVGLNTTSRTTQVGTAAFFEQQTVLAQSGSMSNKIKAIGVRMLSLVAERSGIRYDTLHTWLLFVIFPGLILALIIINVVQQRRRVMILARGR